LLLKNEPEAEKDFERFLKRRPDQKALVDQAKADAKTRKN